MFKDIYSYKELDNDIGKRISKFLKDSRDIFLNRKDSNPTYAVSDRFFVHLLPCIDLTVRIILEDQPGYDEFEVDEPGNLAVSDGYEFYLPNLRLGLELPHRMEMDSTDYEIISLGENIHKCLGNQYYLGDGSCVCASDLSDESIKSLTEYLLKDLNDLKNLPFTIPGDIVEKNPELAPNPFNVPCGEYFKLSSFSTKKFNNSEELKKDLQSFICQYAGSILAIDQLTRDHIDEEAEPISVHFEYQGQLCEFYIKPNSYDDEPLEAGIYLCDLEGNHIDEFDDNGLNLYTAVEHHFGIADLNNLADTLALNCMRELTEQIERYHENTNAVIPEKTVQHRR